MPRTGRPQEADRGSIRLSKRTHSQLFSLFFSSSSEGARASCTVSKKVEPSAVARNLLKRRVREVLRPLLPSLPPGMYRLSAKKPSAGATFAELTRDIRRLLGVV